MKEKKHLMKEGLEEIRKIKAEMNKGRKIKAAMIKKKIKAGSSKALKSLVSDEGVAVFNY